MRNDALVRLRATGRSSLRLLAFVVLLPVLSAGMRTPVASPVAVAEDGSCSAGHEAIRQGPRVPAHVPHLAAATPAADFAVREAGREAPPVTRSARSASRHTCPAPAAARARANRIAWLGFREHLDASSRGSFFGSTAPPPSLS